MSGRKTTPTAPTPEQELALLRAQLASLSRDNESLAAENARLAAEAAEGAAALSEMSARVASLQSTIDSLVERIKLANLRYFAPRSERVPDDQMCLSLFNDAEAWADPGEPEPGPAHGDDAPMASASTIGSSPPTSRSRSTAATCTAARPAAPPTPRARTWRRRSCERRCRPSRPYPARSPPRRRSRGSSTPSTPTPCPTTGSSGTSSSSAPRSAVRTWPTGPSGRVDRYLPWSEEVPDSCRLTKATVDEEAALPDEPIVDAEAMGALSDNS